MRSTQMQLAGTPTSPRTTVTVSTQTYTHEPGSLEAFSDSCEVYRRQLRSVIAAYRAACDRSQRPTPSSPSPSLLCPNCKEMFDARTRPALALPCGHSYCRICVQKAPRSRSLHCVLDGKSNIIPMDGFPPDFLVMELAEKARAAPEFLCTEHSAAVVGFCRSEGKLLCGECVFLHRTHQCVDFQSEQFERFLHDLSTELQRALEDTRTCNDNWLSYSSMFEMCYMQLACSALMNTLTYKEMLAMSMGMPANYDRQESAFKSACVLLEDIRKLNYELLEVARRRLADLEALCREFRTLSSPQQVMLCAATPRERVDFEQFLREFGVAVAQANAYGSQTFVPMQTQAMF